jgi:hypothetical protein
VVTEFGEEITCPELWAVPADATEAFVSGEGPGGAFEIQQIEDGDPTGVCAFSPQAWRSAPEPLPGRQGTPPAGDGVNAGLDGRMVFRGFIGAGEGSGFIDFTVADGSQRFLPLPPGLGGLDVAFPYVTRDGQEIAFVQDEPDSGELGVEQITIQTLDGTRTAAFEKPDSFAGQPRISPDGQLVAVEWHSIELGDDGGVPVVTVFDRAGEVRVRWPQTDEWDWLPDGRLLVADRNVILVSNAALDELTEVAVMPDAIGAMQVSPDGTRLAFGMNGHIWTMGVDGTGLRRMTTGRHAVALPAWSPDGRYLTVQVEELCPEVYVVPADAERLSVGDPAVTPAAMALRKLDDGTAINVCAFSAMSWR